MIALSTLLPSLVIDLPGCPTARINQALREVVRDFCRKTEVWHEDLAAIAAVEDQEDYTLSSTYATAVIHRVSSVAVGWYDDSAPELDTDDWSYERRTAVLSLKSAPLASQDSEDITPHVVFMPLRTNVELPDFLMQDYDTALIAGTLAQLQGQPGELWSNPAKAEKNGMRYQEALTDILIDEICEGQPGDIVMTVGSVL